MALGKPEIVKSWAGKDQNVYRREVLYQEVWNFPITEVAKKYAVSDVTIHRVCREMEIPTPPVGYWAKKTGWAGSCDSTTAAKYGQLYEIWTAISRTK